MGRNDRPPAAQFGSGDADVKTSGVFKGELEYKHRMDVESMIDRADLEDE